MRKRCAFLLCLTLVAAACGGSGNGDSEQSAEDLRPAADSVPQTAAVSEPDPAVTDPVVTDSAVTDPPVTEPSVSTDPVTITSDDGDLFITLPGDIAAELGVSVRRLDSSELPPEVAGGDNLDSVKVYELQPDGATFDEPVTVTRRLDVAAFDFLDLGPNDVPFLTALNRTSSGTYGLLDDLTMTRLGDDLFLSGTTTHFSSFIASNEGSAIRDVDPTSASDIAFAQLQVEQGLDAALGAIIVDSLELESDGLEGVVRRFIDFALRASPRRDDLALETAALVTFLMDDGGGPVAPPTVTVDSTPLGDDTEVIAMTQTSTFNIPIANAPSARTLTEGNAEQPMSIEYAVRTFAVEAPAADFPQPYLSRLRPVVTVETNHTALDAYASFLRVLMTGLEDLPAGDRLFLAIQDAGSAGGDSRLVDIRPLDVLADGSAIVDLGIECFCEYEFMMFFLEASGELAAQALDEATSLDEALAIVGAQDNIARLLFEEFPDAAAVFGVGSAEGPIVEDVQTVLQPLAIE